MIKKSLLAIVVLLLVFSAYLYTQIRQLEVETLSSDLFVIRGEGGNTTVLKTEKGTVVVDSMTFKTQGKLIRERAQELTGQDVVLLINTHYHLDHSHGNPGFDPATQIVATQRTLSHQKNLYAWYWEDDNAEFLPDTTFTDERVFDMGDKTVVVMHPGKGHTDGDLVVHIPEEDTTALGDLFFNGYYPNIDLEAGGSIADWPASIDKSIALGANRYIPGHGATAGVEELLAFKAFMQQLGEIGTKAYRNKQSLEEVLGSKDLTTDSGFEHITLAGIPIGLHREFVLRRTWEEATGNFVRKN